jgi:hypothetical protein
MTYDDLPGQMTFFDVESTEVMRDLLLEEDGNKQPTDAGQDDPSDLKSVE